MTMWAIAVLSEQPTLLNNKLGGEGMGILAVNQQIAHNLS